MKTIKILLAVLAALILIILIGVAYVWREIAFTEDVIVIPANEGIVEQALPMDERENTSEPEALRDEPVTDSDIVPDASFTVSLDSLSESQRSVLEALGFEGAEFIVTPGMVECAIEALGVARVEELRNGDAPSLTEGLSLLSCSTRS